MIPQQEMEAFFYEEIPLTTGFPIINGFIQHQRGEYETFQDWQEALTRYINADLYGFMVEATCHPSAEIQNICSEILETDMKIKIVQHCMNMEKPNGKHVYFVHVHGKKSQFIKIKLKSDGTD